MGRTGSCFDNSAAEAFLSTLEWEVLRRHHFATKDQARQVISNWANDFYNLRRRHSTMGITLPVVYEQSLTLKAKAAKSGTLHGSWGSSGPVLGPGARADRVARQPERGPVLQRDLARVWVHVDVLGQVHSNLPVERPSLLEMALSERLRPVPTIPVTPAHDVLD